MSTPSPSPASSRPARCRATTRIKYATSILDYVFRELAVSYMGRFDLAHVDPSEVQLRRHRQGRRGRQGAGAAQQQVPVEGPDPLAHRQSRRHARRQPPPTPRPAAPATSPRSPPTAPTARAAPTRVEGAVALKQEAQHDLSPTEKLEALQWSKAGAARRRPRPSKAERRAEAKAKGYEGEMCGECGNFTLVRNGTCMKCDTCGSRRGVRESRRGEPRPPIKTKGRSRERPFS